MQETGRNTGAPALDVELALSRLGGDRELFREIALLFLGDAGRMLREIEDSAAAGDPDALHRAAHTLKGCVSNFAADRVYDAALALERMGRAGDLSAVATALQTLKEQSIQLERALRMLIAGG